MNPDDDQALVTVRGARGVDPRKDRHSDSSITLQERQRQRPHAEAGRSLRPHAPVSAEGNPDLREDVGQTVRAGGGVVVRQDG